MIGKPSQTSGLPFPVILRTSMGISGAKYVALLRGIVGIFMFGVQTFFISKSIGYLIRILIFSIDSNILEQDYNLVFFMGLNLIDGLALTLTLLSAFPISDDTSFSSTLSSFISPMIAFSWMISRKGDHNCFLFLIY